MPFHEPKMRIFMEDLNENFFVSRRKYDRICGRCCVYFSNENDCWRCAMSTKQGRMKQTGTWAGNLMYGILGLAANLLCVMGYYPLVPAFYAACCLDRKRNLLLYIGLFAGMGLCMSPAALIKYLFVLLVLGMAIRFYVWANRRCSGWTAGVIAGIVTTAMNTSGLLILQMEKRELVLGCSEGIAVFALAVLFHYGMEMGMQLLRVHRENGQLQTPEGVTMTGQRMHAFAEAVDGLSAAFSSMDQKNKEEAPGLDALAQEITGKLCAGCDGCAVCLEQRRPDFFERVRRMLQAVSEHQSKEEILRQNYMEGCPQYSGMVEEAIFAFSRMELNEAWYHRLQENRRVIAGQLDAMADALQDWNQGVCCVDERERRQQARVIFEARERGIVAQQVHIYEDREKRRMVTARVASRWGGGIPMKNYRKALERATGVAMRLQQDARAILTQDAVEVTAYEDTCFYTLSGVATQKEEGSSVSGDNFCVFSLEDGHSHICLSDGMGSGPAAAKESDMVVELMQKFMEAGFAQETAIGMMNSAMVLKDGDESYSTLDFAGIDLYTGMLTITKIGAAASFVRHRGEVSCMRASTLPAGVDASCAGDELYRKLAHGDFLVMVTDGVLEYLHVKHPEEKLAEMIKEIHTENAETFASTLMEHVMLFTGGHAPDDMTIIVTGIWEK